jgi:O-antigen/teichoic acid export membrane protein
MRNQPGDERSALFNNTDLQQDLNRKAVRGGASVMGAELASNLLRIGSTAVLARLLLPEDFGLLAMVTAFTVFAERFKDFGLGDATVQSREINQKQVSNLFWINLGICSVLSLALALLSDTIAWFYQEPRLTSITLVLASTLLCSGFVIQQEALLRRQLSFGVLSFIQICSIVLSVIVAILLAYYGFGYWALVLREFSRTVFMVIATWFACPWRPGLPQREPGLAAHLHFGRNVTGFNLIHFFSRSIDRVLIGKLYGPSWVGLYFNAYQLMALPVSQIQYPINTVALPALCALQEAPSEFRAYYEKMTQLLAFIVMPCVVFLAIFADMIINILLGPNWSQAVPVFQILAVGAFVEPLVHGIGPVLVAQGNTKKYFRMGFINAIGLICCLLIGCMWGPIGIATGYSIAMYISVVVCIAYGLRNTPIRIQDFIQSIMASCIISILMAVFLLFVRYAVGWFLAPQWLFIFFIVYAVTYLGLWVLVPGGKTALRDYWNYSRMYIFSVK